MIGYMVFDFEGLQFFCCILFFDFGFEFIFVIILCFIYFELEDLEDIMNFLLFEYFVKVLCVIIFEYFFLSYCENVSDVGVLLLMQKCVSFQSIDLDNMWISDLVFVEVVLMVFK